MSHQFDDADRIVAHIDIGSSASTTTTMRARIVVTASSARSDRRPDIAAYSRLVVIRGRRTTHAAPAVTATGVEGSFDDARIATERSND